MIILDLNKKDVDLIFAALDTHEDNPDEDSVTPERMALVESVRERLGADPPSLMVTGDELAEIDKLWTLTSTGTSRT